MAWITSSQELRYHPKTKRLARRLDLSPAAAIGHLHCLWWWAVDYAPDGDLSDLEDWEIADAAGYEGDSVDFVMALVYSGFLDNNEEGRLYIHDWSEHAGQTIEMLNRTKKNNRDRQRRYREKRRLAKEITDSNADVTGDSNVIVTDSNADVTGDSNADVTEITPLHNININNNTTQDNITQDNNSLPPSLAGGESEDQAQNKRTDLQQKRFAEFWSVYPKKKSKGSAEKAWNKIKPDKQLFEKIIKAVGDNIRLNTTWQKDNGQFIPYPATWLNAKGWEDSLEDMHIGGERGAENNDPGASHYTAFRQSSGFRKANTEPNTDN